MHSGARLLICLVIFLGALTLPPVADAASPPGAPGLEGNPGPGAGVITLKVTDLAPDPDSPTLKFRIFRSGSSDTLLVELDRTSNSVYTTDTTCPRRTFCGYRASALNAVGESPKSPLISLFSADVPGPPLAVVVQPEVVRETTPLHRAYAVNRITWRFPIDSGGVGAYLTRFLIYRGPNTSSMSLIGSIPVWETQFDLQSYDDRFCPQGTVCNYWVTAENTAFAEGPPNGVPGVGVGASTYLP